MSLVSVVVPIYNVQDYLEDCLDSLRAQTLEDIEILCVNDGSTDGSLAVLQTCAARDPRIRIIDKPNGGLSSARNAGIDAARSPYVCFLDSDDRFESHACEEMYRALHDGGADVFTFAARWTPEDAAPEWMVRALSPRDAVYEGFSPDLLFREDSRPFAWRTACRAEFLRGQGLRFDESLRFGEDQAFHFAVYPRARKTVLSSQRLYEYRLDRPGSLMGTIQNDIVAKLDRHLTIVERISADWRDGGLLDLCPAEFVSFMVDFVAYDAVKLHDEDYRRIAGGLGDVFRSCWSSEAMREMGLEPAVADIAIRACLETDMPRRRRTFLALRYFIARHGLLSVVKRAVLGRR